MDGFFENADSWRSLLKGPKKRGLKLSPELECRRWRIWVLYRLARCLPRDPRATVLGSQDCQCDRSAANVPAREGQGRAAGHLDGRAPETRKEMD